MITMGRLTKHGYNNLFCLAVGVSISDAIDRLAAYEDTGLTPEEITKAMDDCANTAAENQWVLGLLEELGELLQAKKDGRLVVLPCKFGDTVYRIIHTTTAGPHIAKAVVAALHLGETEKRRFKRNHAYIVLKNDDCFTAHVDVNQIGKTVFLTREEAEAALKGGAG